jgi:hypothetical protein
MDMYSFVSPCHEAKFCGVQSCVFDKLGCTASEKGCRTFAKANGLSEWSINVLSLKGLSSVIFECHFLSCIKTCSVCVFPS